MAAAMSTADGLVLAISNALSHDVYYNMIDPKADVRKRLIVARLLLVVVGAAGAYIASMRITSILGAVAWAFDFAMSGLFFPLVLGVWWKRATREGAIAGMLSGLAAGTAYLIYVYPKFMGNPAWLGIDHLRFGLIGAPVCLVVIGAAAAYISSMRLTSILGAVAWAFDFAMSGLFFPLVLGVWWKRATKEGAVAGILGGLISGTAYVIYVGPKFMANTPWLGIDHLRFGIIGASVSLVAMVVVSLMTKEPSSAVQKMVDDVRVPSGRTILGKQH